MKAYGMAIAIRHARANEADPVRQSATRSRASSRFRIKEARESPSVRVFDHRREARFKFAGEKT